MNENENVELVNDVLQDVSGNNGVSLDNDNFSGLLSPDVSAGDVGEVEQSTDSGYGEGADSPESNADSVSGSDCSTSDTVCETTVDYTRNLEEIEAGIKGINALLLLVFMFLLLEWTEKKFSVIVKRFSERRRR